MAMKQNALTLLREELHRRNMLVKKYLPPYKTKPFSQERKVQGKHLRRNLREQRDFQLALDILESSIWCVVLFKQTSTISIRPYGSVVRSGLKRKILFTGTQQECVTYKLKNNL
jgi:hypothetical protein